MATFSESQVTDLCEILGTNSDVLSQHLDLYEGIISESDKTKVLAIVTKWQALDTANDGYRIKPVTTNKGFDLDTRRKKRELKHRIGEFLQFQMETQGMIYRG